ncbi:MAG: GTP-binding protein, partial [Eubacteriales bacterium]|nr:GTP-binding protein [Eubacteriales bacterium]
HEHHHDHECHHDHDHEHHHHDGECCCGHDHHHHHADEVFTSCGIETAYKFSEQELKDILDKLANSGEYGDVLRAKGIIAADEGEWFHFDLVPEETEIRRGAADYTGRVCVIGSALKEDKVKALFHVAS